MTKSSRQGRRGGNHDLWRMGISEGGIRCGGRSNENEVGLEKEEEEGDVEEKNEKVDVDEDRADEVIGKQRGGLGGFCDDYRKMKSRNNGWKEGIVEWYKAEE